MAEGSIMEDMEEEEDGMDEVLDGNMDMVILELPVDFF